MNKSVARLIEQFKPEGYELTIRPDSDTMLFSGTVTITGRKVGRPSKRLTLHQNGLKISKVHVVRHNKGASEEVHIDRVNTHAKLFEVRLHSDSMLYPGNYTISMDFSGTITPDMNGLYPCYFTHDGAKHTMLMTQFESHYARDVFPCIDEPEAKATFDLTLVTKQGPTVLANTPSISQKTDDGWQQTTFATTPRMSTYLLAFVIGDMHAAHTTTKSGVDVSVWGTIAQPAESFAFALDTAKRSIEFFEDYFGAAYPLAKADHVAVPDFSSGAMENWGLITYREALLLAYPGETGQSTKEVIATVITHETSHQWFGNLVTMAWWDDLWLNESFANMMEYRAVDELFPDWHIWDSFYGHEGLHALRRDATPGVQAIKCDVRHPDEINTLFDPSIVYAKGGRLLYMLLQYLGEADFRAGLRAYFDRHAFQNTKGSDLWAALSQASGKDIASFMNPWLDKAGYPVVQVTQEGTDLLVEQQQFFDTPAAAHSKALWHVPLFAGRKDVPDVLQAHKQSITLKQPEFVRLNGGASGHYLVHYTSAAHRAALIELLQRGDMSQAERVMLLNSSAMLTRGGYGLFGDTLRMLEAYKSETSDSVWDIMSVAIGDARRFVDLDERIDGLLKQSAANLIAEEYSRLGWTEHDGESTADNKLRATIIGLGSYAQVPDVIAVGQKLFADYQTDPAALTGELRSLVFGIAVKTEVPGAVEYLLDLHNNTANSDLKGDVAAALTATRSATVTKTLLGLLQNPDIVKPQDADHWIFNLLRNRYTRSDTWDWMVQEWPWVARIYGRDKSFDYFPRIAASICNTAAWSAKFEALFADKIDDTLLQRNILIGRAEITARVAWLERDLASVQTYFNL